MPYELIFRGALARYWQVIYTEWQRPSRQDPLAPKPFRLSHLKLPEEFEEVTIEFLDEQGRLGLVTVDALSGADGKLVKLIVHLGREAYEQQGKSALLKWNELKNAWERKGWLIDPLAPIQPPAAKPDKPAMPEGDSSLDPWFDWLHSMRASGLKCTLKELAREIGYSHGRIRELHSRYAKARGLDKSS